MTVVGSGPIFFASGLAPRYLKTACNVVQRTYKAVSRSCSRGWIWNSGSPVKTFCFFLGLNALVFEWEINEQGLIQMIQWPGERIETQHLWFLKARVGTRLEVSEIIKDTLFEPYFRWGDQKPES